MQTGPSNPTDAAAGSGTTEKAMAAIPATNAETKMAPTQRCL
mgnify:CR=1 FL=1